MNMKQFEQSLEQLMHGGELRLDITKKEHGFKLVVIEYELMRLTDRFTNEELGTEESNLVRLTIHTDSEGTINFIEHPYQAFTRGNMAEVQFVSSLVTMNIEGIRVELSTYK